MKIFKDTLNDLLKCTIVIYPWVSTELSPKSTGTTPHIIILAEMERTKIKPKETRESIGNDMTDLVNKKGVCENKFHTNTILEEVQQINSIFNIWWITLC